MAAGAGLFRLPELAVAAYLALRIVCFMAYMSLMFARDDCCDLRHGYKV